MKSKLFQQRIELALLDESNQAWELSDASIPVDEQINSWVDESGASIVFVSSPGYQAVWADDSRRTQVLLLAVVVLYTEDTNDERAAEEYSKQRPIGDGTVGLLLG